MEDILVPLGMFALVGLLVWKFYDTRHKERMTIIQSGIINEDLKFLFGKSENTGRFSALKYGLLLFFAGTGFLIGAMSTMWGPEQMQALATTAGTLIGGGLGLVIHYFIVARYVERERRAKGS